MLIAIVLDGKECYYGRYLANKIKQFVRGGDARVVAIIDFVDYWCQQFTMNGSS